MWVYVHRYIHTYTTIVSFQSRWNVGGNSKCCNMEFDRNRAIAIPGAGMGFHQFKPLNLSLNVSRNKGKLKTA